jgi:hypothetical protein
MKERWKAVPGWEGLYEVSDLGRVRNPRTGHIKAQHRHGNKYLQTWLCSPKRNAVCVLVHRLVLAAFKGSPPTDKHEGAHRNGKAADNRLGNLRWALHASNEQDKIRHGTRLRGARVGNSVLKTQSIRYIRKMRARNVPLKALATRYGVHISTISAACCGVSWNHV